ncbi:MAG TPA: chromosome segregation protein SMC [Candidatus Acetothermia bacterium]|nr:chromosome segregation protein SMC [Candidatus Acetothermia bacterium]
MTKINKLELTGFKSFRNKTVVPFFDGMTAVIGENGAGKSNLFDALSFVMGRRSSQMRAERLEHLIFNGGERLSPANTAEVTLYLDNSDGDFNEFFGDDHVPEVTLGRRITRKSSTYTFMGKACSRAMVDRVLETGRIDPDGQQLIAQGRITEIIKRNPKMRREIIDEVSGIAAYDEKRKKAIAELKDVKTKLNTHRVILAERHRRLINLARERDAALEYERLTKEQELLQESIRHRQREQLVERLERAKAERVGMAQKIETLQAEVTKLDLAIENKEWELEGMREDLEGGDQIALVKEVERLRSELITRQGQIDLKQQQVRNLQEMIDEVAKIKAQTRVQPSVSGRNRAVQALLERKRGGVYGTIASLSEPRDGFQVAFETAAGGHMNDVVVDSRETAIECIDYLKKNRLGRARILPLRRLVAGRKSLASADALKLPGVIDYAINLVDFDSKYRRAFEYVLSDAIIVENLAAVRDVDGVRAITLDGDLQSKGGALTGGWRAGAGKDKRAENKPSDTTFDTAKKRQQISRISREIAKLREEIESLTEKLADKEKELTQEQDKKQETKGEATTRSDELHALRERRREAYRDLETLRRNMTRYERQEAETQAELETLGDEEREPSEFIEGSVADLERKIESNRRHLRRLEPINMRAIDEYALYEREYNEFRDRVDALEAEKREIEALIGQIEERKRERFMETLEAINSKFNHTFTKLFSGGSASLELEEEGNISSGLLIKANPPDKEPHVIDSLSGGEQTLVATAFIFALQEYQRAPFFVLDEIDAALDRMNITRLGQMLREYANKIQVIVVSHNEETVRHADRAYGVTIKNGTSQILALNLN